MPKIRFADVVGMDFDRRIVISARMLRQLLTVLALITGFAAAAEPVRAAGVAQSVESASLAEAGSSCVAARAAFADDARCRPIATSRQVFRPHPVVTVLVPTIQLQADRARE